MISGVASSGASPALRRRVARVSAGAPPAHRRRFAEQKARVKRRCDASQKRPCHCIEKIPQFYWDTTSKVYSLKNKNHTFTVSLPTVPGMFISKRITSKPPIQNMHLKWIVTSMIPGAPHRRFAGGGYCGWDIGGIQSGQRNSVSTIFIKNSDSCYFI